MKTLSFIIQTTRSTDQNLDVCAERILVGSGSHCDIRLPLESAGWEHVVITQEDGRIVARSVGTGQMAVDGEGKREAELNESSTIRIDTTTLTLRKITVEEVKKKKSSTGTTFAGVLALLLLSSALFILKTAAARGNDVAPPPPDLFDKFVPTCTERQAAIPLALEKLSLAKAKRERFRFYPHDGVEGVRHFKVAAACFDDGRMPAEAEAARNDAAMLEAEVRDAFHSSRVRLERALVRKDARTALDQVKLQRELLVENKEAEAYCRWLALLQSKLEALASKESK